MPQAVTLTFHRFDRLRDRVWAFAMMGLARPALSRVPGIGFWKLLGSGTGEGFTPLPNTRVYAILATWPDPETARAGIEGAAIFRRYAARASERWTVLLTPHSVTGAWSGQRPFTPAPAGGRDALAALTRATLRPRALWRFWARVPGISRAIGTNRDVAFKIGVGEVPWLHQVTFSIWPDTAAMARFARQGPHAEAIARVRAEGWFREELYARFAVHSEIGTWNGGSPLAKLDLTS